MTPSKKRVKVADPVECNESSKDSDVKAQLEALKLENQRLRQENQQLTEKNEQFPESLEAWKSRYEEAMNKHLHRVVMHGGSAYIPVGVHLREMKTVDTWKRRFEVEQQRRKTLEGSIAKWKQNNNQLLKEVETEKRAHKKTKRLLQIYAPDHEQEDDPEDDESSHERREPSEDVIMPVPVKDIKLEEEEEYHESEAGSSNSIKSTPNELLSHLLFR